MSAGGGGLATPYCKQYERSRPLRKSRPYVQASSRWRATYSARSVSTFVVQAFDKPNYALPSDGAESAELIHGFCQLCSL